MALTDTAIRKAKSESKRYKLTDGGGLFVEVMPSGSKYFHNQFKVNGKESKATLGEYPAMTLAKARQARDPVRDLPNDIFQMQKKTNFNHITERGDLYQLLNSIDGYLGDISTATALKLAPYVFLRPNELAGLRWDENDLTEDL